MLIRVLVICGDLYHPAEVVMAGLVASCESDCVFERAPDGPLRSLSFDYDAVILAKSNACSPTDLGPWADDEADELLNHFVQHGKGMLVIHAGTVGYPRGQGVRKMTGGAFQHHPEACEVTVIPVVGHPITSRVDSFVVHDEHYLMEVDEPLGVFLHSRSQHGVHPAGWSKFIGDGRVCVITPGHYANVWSDPEFQTLIQNAVGWVTNG